MPSLTAPTEWPARPMRCMPLATDGGDSIWMNEVDGAHVDAELKRRRGAETFELAGFQLLFNEQPLRERRASRGARGLIPPLPAH